ncbi:MAG: hypothetical protein V1856_03240 [Candidatus Liptonbacteria bacterium]
MEKQVFIGILILIAAAAGILGYVTADSGGPQGADCSALQAKLEEVKKMFPPLPDSSFISGKVESVSGNTITLNTPKGNPFDEAPALRQVAVTADTKIVKNEPKPIEVFQREQEAYQRKLSALKTDPSQPMPIPPSQSTEKDVPLSDIKQGDQLNVEAATPIRLAEKFEATKIYIQFSAVPVSAPAPVPAP